MPYRVVQTAAYHGHMSLISDLLAKAQLHAKGDALQVLQKLEVTVLSGHVSGMNDTLLNYAERLTQAEEKVVSGAEIMRISELLTLAQFGAGSIGSAIAAIYRSPSSATGLEALYVSRFLTELVVRRREYPALIPADLLCKYAVEREIVESAVARPVLEVIVERARETATRVSIYQVRFPATRNSNPLCCWRGNCWKTVETASSGSLRRNRGSDRFLGPDYRVRQLVLAQKAQSVKNSRLFHLREDG